MENETEMTGENNKIPMRCAGRLFNIKVSSIPKQMEIFH